MDQSVQQRFMYLFERVGEPLYLGPRGSKNTYYMVPTDNLDQKTQHAAREFRRNVSTQSPSVSVKPLTQRPDLREISNSCPKSTLFSYFIPAHRQAAMKLQELLLAQQSLDDFMAMACACRDSDIDDKNGINPRLWTFAFASSCLRRADLKGFKIPAIWEIEPDQFVGPNVVRMAQRQAVLPQQDRSRIVVPLPTGDDSNPENRLAYFREDVGMNSHHWHWHLVYPITAPRGTRDRKGELFYWMHHDMLARYDAERLANGLGRVKPHDLSEPIAEGYFPKLYDTNAGIIWGSRQEGTLARGVDRLSYVRQPVELVWENMGKWRTRIFEAIDTGIVMKNGQETEKLTIERGIDILGDLMESSQITPNSQFYGDFHNMGHVAIAFAHDPLYRHREEQGVMADTTTAMRDPIFYRWHKYIDSIFDRYKGTIPPYTTEELVWPGIRVTDISVQTSGDGRERDILVTNWMQSHIDLSRGLDFGRTTENQLGPILAAVTHLNHEAFSYRIAIQNGGRQQVTGVVRIFIAPRLGENRSRFDLVQQRLLFIAQDRFETVLQPGENVITRKSTDSSVTIPWGQTFRDLERGTAEPLASEFPQTICGCGWPQHMLVPRGTTEGMLFDLYVIVTDGAKDIIPRTNPNTNNARPSCREAATYCGLLDSKYPDRRAMGFPFDRYPRLANNRPLPHIDAFVQDVPNSRTKQIRIVHRDIVFIRTDEIPEGMPTITMQTGSIPSSPSGSRSPSPSSPTSPRPSSPGGRGRGGKPEQNQAAPGGGGSRNWDWARQGDTQFGGRGRGYREKPNWDRPYQGPSRGHKHNDVPNRGGDWGYNNYNWGDADQ